MPIKSRKPTIIAAELAAKLSRARSAFVPPNVTEGLELAAEFCSAVAERLAAGGLDTEPEPDAPAEGEQQQGA
ncbi:MAG: hypothetical protein KBC73_05475 [Burkholderiaceae bacterium]|nr:hypothetical protein [Burkholderiaceae bacterium]